VSGESRAPDPTDLTDRTGRSDLVCDGELAAVVPASLPVGRSALRLSAGAAAAVDLTALRGAPGPTLLVIAAVHGDEYEGPAALAELPSHLDPEQLTGTLLLIPVLNEPACFARSRCGPDGLNLARVFPGKPDGSTTEQIAASLTALLARCDALIDLHAAGTLYTLHPWAGYATNVAPQVLATQRAMAIAFGLDTVWATPMKPGRSLSAAAELGKPAIYVEMTGSGLCRLDDVVEDMLGVEHVMRCLGMLRGQCLTAEPTWFRESLEADEGHLQIDHPSPKKGLFYPHVEVWDRVAEGQALGVLRRPGGDGRTEIVASRAGRVAMLRTAPPVDAGDSLAVVVPFDEP